MQVQYNHTTQLISLGAWVQKSSPPVCVCPAGALNTAIPSPQPSPLPLAIHTLVHGHTHTPKRTHPTHLFSSLLLAFPGSCSLKVKCYSRSKVTINMAKIVSLSFPPGPDTENNFAFSLASADTGVNEDIQPPGPAACSR